MCRREVARELGEECDDMNKINGDGCSLFCLQELSFNCVDEPSRCYFHDGDGVCEEFEQMTSIKDCGVYTPKGFLDQWASNVSVSHHSDQQCPGWVVIGQPAATQMCRTKVIDLNDGVSQYAWYPCTANFQYSHMTQTIFWLKAYFSQPMVAAAVLVHLVTDGTYYLDQKQETIGVQLFDTKEQSHDLGVHVLSCRNNPLIIPVIHDLSHPFYHTQAVLISFSSQFVAISGVALRSFHNFDPITISSCQRGQTYSPAEQSSELGGQLTLRALPSPASLWPLAHRFDPLCAAQGPRGPPTEEIARRQSDACAPAGPDPAGGSADPWPSAIRRAFMAGQGPSAPLWIRPPF